MKNLEQTLAQTLIDQFKFCERRLQENEGVDKDYFTGQKVAIMTIASAIFGQEITGQIKLEFIGNLEKIANSEPKANLVEVSRFEAFALHKHHSNRSLESKKEGLEGLAESYSEKAQTWLDIACEIEKADADNVVKSLIEG